MTIFCIFAKIICRISSFVILSQDGLDQYGISSGLTKTFPRNPHSQFTLIFNTMKRLSLSITLLCFVLGMAAQVLPQDTVTRKGQLPNGLTYYVRKNMKTPGQANFYIAQKVGSVLEEEDQRGLAHFLEHMCFNGTTHFPGDALLRYLESIGVKFGEQVNAYTAIDETVYNINNVPTERTSAIDSVLLILHDWSCDLTLEDKEIDKERGVIHEEWRQRNSAQMRILDRQLPTLMSGSRPGHRMPIGLMSVVDNFPYQTLRDYYEKWYRPDLQAIIVVGDIDPDRTESKIKDLFSPITMPENPAQRVYYGVEDNEEPIVVTDHDPEQPVPTIAVMQKHQPFWPENQKNTAGYLKHDIVVDMVTKMFEARIQDIVEKPETPFLAVYFFDDDFLLSKVSKSSNLYVIPKEGKPYEAVSEAVKVLCTVLDHGFLQSELDRCKAALASELELRYQNRGKRENSEYVQECLDNFLESEPLISLEDYTAIATQFIPAITLEDVNDMVRRMFSRSLKGTVVFAMNPENEGYEQPTADLLLQAVKDGFGAQTSAYTEEVMEGKLVESLPAPGSVTKSKKGHFGGRDLTLSNGVRVIMLPTTHSDDEILMQAFSPGGTSRYGLEDAITLTATDILCSVSRLGGFKQTDLRKMLAGKQAQASSGMGSRNEYIGGGCSSKDLETMLQLVRLQFMPQEPDMDAAQNIMMQYYTQLQGKESDPLQTFGDSVTVTRYGHNPRQVIMTKEKLAAVDYQRALQIKAERFADASDFTFLFVGTFDEDSLTRLCCQYLATLPTVKRDDTPVNTDLLLQKGIVNNVYRARMEQPICVASVCLHAPAMGNSLREQLTMSILGQALDMTFIKSIREEMGASYGIDARGRLMENEAGKWDYIVSVQGSLKPELYDTCLTVIREEMERIAQEGIPAEYLQRIKQYMQKSFQEDQNRNGSWLSYMKDYYQYGIDSNTTYLSTLESISQKDIMRVMNSIVSAGNQTSVVMLPQE